MTLVYKALISLVHSHLCTCLRRTESRYALRVKWRFAFLCSSCSNWNRKQSFSLSAPSAWNDLQSDLKLRTCSTESFCTLFVKQLALHIFNVCVCNCCLSVLSTVTCAAAFLGQIILVKQLLISLGLLSYQLKVTLVAGDTVECEQGVEDGAEDAACGTCVCNNAGWSSVTSPARLGLASHKFQLLPLAAAQSSS